MPHGERRSLVAPAEELSTFEDAMTTPRGWAMRRGHRRRLARETGRESCRGRATYAKSANKGCRRLAADQVLHHREQRKQARWQRLDIAFSFSEFQQDWQEDSVADDSEALFGSQSWGPWGDRCISKGSQGDVFHVNHLCQADEDTEYESRQSNSDTVSSDSWSPSSSGDGLATDGRRRCGVAGCAVAWEVAVKRADEVALAYVQSLGGKSEQRLRTGRRRLPRSEVAPPAPPSATPLPAPIPREQQSGYHSPFLEYEHTSALAAARQATACRKGTWKARRAVVGKESAEYRAVTEYFMATCSRHDGQEIVGVERVQNAEVFRRFAEDDEDLTVMFHGCKTCLNEDSIVAQGFQVAHCRSGGSNFGTWFAYNASYSDSGFIYSEAGKGSVCHIFVCLVSRRYVVKDDATMRVVAQDCAYPMWILRYRHTGCARTIVPRAPRSGQRPIFFFVVKDGRWVLEDRR